NYTQSSTGTLAIEIGPTAASKLAVGGSAALAGTLALTVTSGRFLNKSVFPIVTAGGGVTGTFGTLTGASTPQVSFAVRYLANEVDLIASAASLTTLGGTANQRAVSAALDQASPGTGTLASALLAAISLPSDPQILSAFDQIGGAAEGYGNLATTALGSGRAVTSLVGQQLHMTRGGAGGALAEAPGGAARVQLASLDPTALLAQGPAPRPSYVTSPWSAWLTGFGVFGTTAGNGNAHTLNYTTGGTAFGADYRLDPALLVGAFTSYGGSGTAARGLSGSGQVDSYAVGVYGSWSLGRAYVDGTVGYAYNDSSLRRTVAFPGFAATSARGSTNADQFLASLETGRRYDVAPVAITPFVGLQASALDQASFTETGAGALNLAVGRQSVSSVRSQLGARVSRDLDLGEGMVVNAGLKLGWAHELSDTGATTTASFAGTAGTGFAVQGAQRGRDSALVGAGIAATLDPQASLYLRYDGDLNGRDDTHAVIAGVRLTW
ncbi:MAG: autotransporter outer membrane beta-barrel domain-containing protein, partial [Proteobacteria bacterium]|nr:autotransporter outer membrane beta-barrel domain-containing protein [Pseudomonadota bacterium]